MNAMKLGNGLLRILCRALCHPTVTLRVHSSEALIIHSLFSFSQFSIVFVMNYVSLDYQTLREKFNWHVLGLVWEL